MAAALVAAAIILSAGYVGAEELPAAPELAPTAQLLNFSRPTGGMDRLKATSLVSAGGVSLGSYGAGFLYYYTLARKALGDEPSLKIATGTSAGSINAVLAALALCKKSSFNPEDNVFFNTWIPVGMRGARGMPGLKNLAKVTARSLFSREPIEQVSRSLGDYFYDEASWDTECRTLLGIVSTRLEARSLPLQATEPTPAVPRQTQKFLISLENGPIAGPRLSTSIGSIENAYLYDHFPILGHPPLPKTPNGPPDHALSFEDLADVLKASSSFPYAFEPYVLPTTDYSLMTKRWSHTQGLPGCDTNCEGREFVDGAVYENVPLNLARLLARETNETDPTTIVIDTEATPWKRADDDVPEPSARDAFSLAAQIAGSVVSSTMSAELLSTFEKDPALRASDQQVAFTVRNLPTASGHVANFLGFFERDFRIFDFYLGMADARSFIAPDHARTEKRGSRENHLAVASADEARWDLMRCFEAWQDASENFSQWPRAVDLGACHRLRVGIWDEDSHTWKNAPYYEHADDRTRTRYNVIRLLAAAQTYRDWESANRTAGMLPATEAWFAELRRQGFRLRDSEEYGLASAGQFVRAELYEVLEEFAAKQPFAKRTAARLGARLGANALSYLEPKHMLAVGLHSMYGFELGWGVSRSLFRFELNGRLQDMHARVDRLKGIDVRGGPRFTLALGRHWFGPVAQLEFFTGLASQWQFRSSGDAFSFRPELGAYLVLLQRLYVTAMFEMRYRFHTERGYDQALFGERGLSSGVFGSVGWRFLWRAASH